MNAELAARLLDVLVKTSVQVAVLACLVWVVCRLARKAPAGFRCALWILVLVKCFVPPVIGFPSQLAFWTHTRQAAPPIVAQQNAPIPQPAASPAQPVQPAPAAAGPTSAVASSPSGDMTAPVVSHIWIPSWPEVVLLLWFIGVLGLALRLLVRVRRQRGVLQGDPATDENLLEMLERAASSLGIHRLPRFYVSEAVCTPTLVGLARPVIVLPSQVVESCSPDETRAMLLHELAHIKRLDMLWLWLYEAARAVFFFHPAVWLAGKQMETERELACDELVVRASCISAADYAAGYLTVLKLARLSAMRVSLGMAEPFEVGKRRVEMILRERIPRLSVGWVVLLGVTVALGLPTFAGVRGADKALPQSIVALLAEFKQQASMSSGLSSDLFDGRFVKNNKKAKTTLKQILGYAWISETAFDTLAESLFSDLEHYAEQYKPGAKQDDAFLKQRTFRLTELPGYGVGSDVYILLEMAKLRKSPEFTSRVLSSACDAMQSASDLSLRMSLARHPELSDEFAREVRENGGELSQTGAEIAWYCEWFIIDTRRYDLSSLPQPAVRVTAEYADWRKGVLAKGHLKPHQSLPSHYQHQTMAFVKRLADVLGGATELSNRPAVPRARPAKRSPAALEFYYLRDVKGMNNPTGRWRMAASLKPGDPYIFTDAKGVVIDSIKQPQRVLDKVVRRSSNPPVLTAADIVPNAKAVAAANGKPVVTIEFNEHGAKVFREFTRKHVADYLAIFCDGRLLTAPTINEAIPGGHAEVSGFKTIEEAQSVADKINGKPGAPQ